MSTIIDHSTDSTISPYAQITAPTMPAHHAGSFGQGHPYQLPPPRLSAPLQFGPDPFLPQRIPSTERNDSAVGRHSNDVRPSSTRKEQLPPVSHLLTHTSPPSSPSCYHPPPAFGTVSSNHEYHDFSQSFHHHHDHGLSAQMSQVFVFGESSSQPEPRPRHQTGSLPPISHVALQTSGGEKRSYAAAHADTPSQTFQNGQRQHGIAVHSKSPLTEVSPPENTGADAATSSHSQKPPVRPHVVDEKYIEGEGLCYIYADGSHCPKSIDGMPVNANWGVTKAGKPRKRLAQACVTCREKKIKCQPNLPKCDQCQKSGRDCRFESAPRGNRASMKALHSATPTSKSDAKDSHSPCRHSRSDHSNYLYSAVRASSSSTSLPGTGGQSPASDVSTRTPSGLDNAHESRAEPERGHTTRIKGSIRTTGVDDRLKHTTDAIEPYASTEYAELLMEVKDVDPGDPLTSDWNKDPYETDAELTTHYIESYFTHVNDALYYMFPRGRFILWLRSCRTKSLADKMLLYSMMTLGSVFSDRPDKVMTLKRISRTARYAMEHSQHNFTLQLAQSRIIMSLWYYAIGALVKAWDSIGAAVRTVCGLRYNIESGGVTASETQVCEYGLHPQALIECRRRTFWIAFLIERLSTLYSPSSIFIPSQTAMLRLPCREEIYEAQEYGTVPYFQDFLNQGPLSTGEDLSRLSPMAFLVGIVSLWSDVSQHVFYSPHIPAEAYGKLFKEFHTTIVRRAEEWVMRLPSHLTFTAENLERSIRARKADAFISIHLMYHVTLMKLNRHARYPNLPSGTVDQYIHNARHHAVEILRICLALTQYASDHHHHHQSSRPVPEALSLRTAHLNPFLGYVILAAVDALSAAGLTSELTEYITLIKGGLDTIKELGRFWDSSLLLASLIETRIDFMVSCLENQSGKLGFVLDGTPLHTRVRVGALKQHPIGAVNQDLLYGGLPRERLFRALGVENVSVEDDILCIREGD